MVITNRTIWQQACGDNDRNYSDVCLEWDVILNGPGYAGRYPDCDLKLSEDNWSSKKRTDIMRFATKMKPNDIVVLKIGTSMVYGVGEIVGDYEWLDFFSDIDGWDLQHVRRVRWLWKYNGKPMSFNTYDLKQGDTTQILNSKVVENWLSNLKIPSQNYKLEPKTLPSERIKTLNQDEIAEYLYAQGVSNNSIEELLNEFHELQRIAKWYQHHEKAPSEFETLTYLVVPLLRALGWSPQKMGIEWHKVDVALFDQLPREDKNLSVVVEVKKKGNSCLTAYSQAQGYSVGKENCLRLIVTDGLRYGVYLKVKKEYKLEAYFSLVDLKESSPVYNCKGVREALRIMTPEWRQ